MKRVAFYTFGCRLNQYDTETLRTLLEDEGGYRTVDQREDADVYVVNTCSVTARADATARKTIRRLHDQRPFARIVVTGCYAQRAPEDVAALPGVSLVLGAADRAGIARALAESPGNGPRMAVSPIEDATTFLEVPIAEMAEHSRAFVKVQEGCNEACSFCIIPQTRGRSRSRERGAVLNQVRALADAGYAEIVLTGVHLGDYGRDLARGERLLEPLIERVLAVPGVARVRLSSIEPASVSDALLDLMAGEPRFARHFHIPLQSASDPVLARMRRRYTGGDFVRLVERIAERVPGCGIGTDVICGFPGEEDADFQRTFDALAALPITYLHPFTYSARPGSEAEGFGEQVPGEVAKRRTRALRRLSADKARDFRASQVGETLEVLVEEHRDGLAIGTSDNYLRVRTAAAVPRGSLLPVRITGAGADGLEGDAPAGRALPASPGH